MQIKFKNIVVPFDNSKSSEKALEMAIKFARLCDSRIILVHAVVSSSRDKSAEIKDMMSELAAGTGIKFLFLKGKGRIHSAIIEAGESVDMDLIIMGTHGASGMQEFWIGSNAFRVVSSASVPVITVRENVGALECKNLYLPIDDSKDTRQKVPMAIAMAKLLNADIHLLETSRYTADDTVAKLKRYGDQVMEIIEAEGVPVHRATQIGGDISDNVVNYANENGQGMIIMMSESESATGLFLGSNAQKLVNHSAIPVMTLHSKDISSIVLGY